MALSASIALALLAAAVGHPDGLEADRRLTWVHEQHIWSGGDAQCSSHLSDGPADADVELRLGGLPPSTANEAVHLQWWSARKSPTRYDPLVTPVNVSVHADVIKAYPQHSDADFNGGNVRVSASGEAVIRVRAPSTYYMWQYIAVPHVHLRLCKGASGFHTPTDAVMMNGPDVWVSSARGYGQRFRVLSAQAYAARQASPSASVGGSSPVALVVGVARGQSGSATSPETATLPESTTTMPITTTTEVPMRGGCVGVKISAARDALDLDALEFSPVYTCLLEQKFYDHFSSGCVRDCPAASAVAHGQCVRERTPEPEARLEASWQLSVECGTPCWHNRKKVTLHNVRLSFAGHLDIPFQEIEISTGFSNFSSRRLSSTRTAHLTVKVASDRIAAAEGSALLGSFPADAASMAALLGLDVRAVARSAAPNQQQDTTTMDQGSDPYAPAYTAIEDLSGRGAPTPSALSILPTEAIIGIAAGVVLLALAMAGLVWRRRRQRRAASQAQQAKTIEDKVAEAEANSIPELNKPACV